MMYKILITEIFEESDVDEEHWEPWDGEGTLIGWDWRIQHWETDDDEDDWWESELPMTWRVNVRADPHDEVIFVR